MLFPLILFTISLPFVLADDYADTWVGAYSIPFHEPIYGAIDFPNDWDFFQIRLIAGRGYQITALSYFDNYLRVYDPGLNILFAVDNAVGSNAQGGFIAPSTGQYYIAVTGATIYALGSYLVAVVDLSSCSATCTCKFVVFSSY